MYYQIGKTLKECDASGCRTGQPYVAVLTMAEWLDREDSFDMGIEQEISLNEIYITKAEVNYDSLTGTFSIPHRQDLSGQDRQFAFAMDEKGIVFIDDDGMASEIITEIRRTKQWRVPCIERFLYDFLEQIVHGDLRLMESYEQELAGIEREITENGDEECISRANEIRSDLRVLRIHYEQLIDLGQELEENENDFFNEDNLRYFRMFTNRVQRLYDSVTFLREYTVQLGDMYRIRLETKQNRIMTVLTVVSTIFMPLTLIVGWYGMNFRYMPELQYRYAYPVVFIVCIVIVVFSIVFFRKKKLL